MSMKRPFPDSDAVMLKTDVLLKNNNRSMSVLSHNVITENSIAEYSKNSGVVYGNPTSIIDFDLANLAENLREQSAKMYEEFYNADKIDIDSSYLKSIKLRVDNINFENVFHKFRGCLDKFRDAFAVEIGNVPSLTVGSTTYDVAYLKESTPTTLTYVDMNNTTYVKTMVEMLESIKNKVLDILKNPPAPAATTAAATTAATTAASSTTAATSATATAAAAAAAAAATAPATASSTTTATSTTTTAAAAATAPPSLSTLSYNDKDIDNIKKNDFDAWSAKEVGILEEPQNHESVLYVIGQVFNIIDPTHYKSFLTDKPSSASSLSSISKTNFFQFIVKDPNITSISKDGTLYVGETKDDKKEGKGMMRWANGSIFEGTFANDSIKTNVDGIFNGNPLIITNANGTATLGGAAGTFNMDTGEFTPTPTSTSP